MLMYYFLFITRNLICCWCSVLSLGKITLGIIHQPFRCYLWWAQFVYPYYSLYIHKKFELFSVFWNTLYDENQLSHLGSAVLSAHGWMCNFWFWAVYINERAHMHMLSLFSFFPFSQGIGVQKEAAEKSDTKHLAVSILHSLFSLLYLSFFALNCSSSAQMNGSKFKRAHFPARTPQPPPWSTVNSSCIPSRLLRVLGESDIRDILLSFPPLSP